MSDKKIAQLLFRKCISEQQARDMCRSFSLVEYYYGKMYHESEKQIERYFI